MYLTRKQLDYTYKSPGNKLLCISKVSVILNYVTSMTQLQSEIQSLLATSSFLVFNIILNSIQPTFSFDLVICENHSLFFSPFLRGAVLSMRFFGLFCYGFFWLCALIALTTWFFMFFVHSCPSNTCYYDLCFMIHERLFKMLLKIFLYRVLFSLTTYIFNRPIEKYVHSR